MRLSAAMALAALVAACAPPPAPLAGPDAADPAAAVRPLTYTPLAADPAGSAPAEPLPWTEMNRRVAPKAAP